MALCATSASAQTVNVPFSTQAAGKRLPISWGMDTAWDDEYNVKWGIAHYGANFTTGRISFQPYALVDASKIDDATANFGLPDSMAVKLQARIDKIKWTGTTKVAINCDHEVLTKKIDKYGNYGSEENNFGKSNYQSGSSTGSMKTAAWVNLIKASVKYAQAQGLEVVSVSPFNEPDYGWNQFYNGAPGTSTTNQQNYGMRDLKAIYTALKADDFFKTGAGKNVRMCGPNTLNCDRALPWYNYSGMAALIDEGNTHQLSGSFDNYASFFKTISDAGKVATADELHNVGEAMVGVEYGMTNGIWWAFDAKARGQFMHDSNEGVRLGYAEDRSHWTSAAVYRNDRDGEIHGFIGSSERQANVSTYNFQCQDREVYFNGYGPQKEWSVTTVGGAANSYQKGQINYEYLFDITYGEDVQSAPVDGNYQIMSAADMKLLTFTNGADVTATTQANNTTQRWHIYPDNEKKAGDCSYWYIDLQSNADAHLNLRNGNLAAGATLLTYNANHDALEQFYFRYAKDGYFYIITRQSNKYMYNNNGSISVQEGPTSKTGANELKKYLWRLMPTDATAEQTAPATPAGLAEGTVNATSASISWTAVTGESKAVTYNVLRQDANGWNTIARCQSGTTYTDNKVEAGKGYRYKVQAVDYSGNRSETSEAITIIVPEEEGGETPTFTAGQWEWTGEKPSANNTYYLYAEVSGLTNKFLNDNNGFDATPTVKWTMGGTFNSSYTLTSNNSKQFALYRQSYTNYVKTDATGKSGQDIQLASAGDGIYTIYRANKFSSGNRNVQVTTSGLTGTCQSNATSCWKFISESQMTKYGKMSDYTSAFNTAKGYLTADISSALKKELVETLDACDGTINYQNIEGYISRLNGIAERCRNYTPSAGEDFTGLIINPSIIQNGTTNDAPTGWKGATTNVTGNGHWTEGTGDTRLEAWNWSTNANGLSVDYYQDVIVPNGLYTLTAVTHQRANGDAALYGETYRNFDTTMPVGDGNEAVTTVQSILVTDGTLRIGMKATNDYSGVDNQWATADNFTLTRESTPEETDLSHYTDAIAYLNAEAEKELGRNVDHTELMAAYNAANRCAANVAAYETAINKLAAAIKRSQAMVAAEPVLSGSWVGQSGTYAGDAAERYNWGNPYSAGRVLYQVVEDLIPGAQYKIEFYAVANVARDLDASLYSGSGIAYVFANDTEEDINVIYQAGCVPTDYPRTLTAVADKNGQIAYGIANRKAGGQWYVAKAKSITYLGMPHTANLKVKAGKYGTFVAPFAVDMPEGVKAYTINGVEGTSVKLAEVVGSPLAAHTPVIVLNDSGADVDETFTATIQELPSATVTAGGLVGFYIKDLFIPINGSTYVLQTQNGSQAFYKVATAFQGTQNRCYLALPSGDSNGVKAFYFEDDEETDVEAPLTTGNEQAAVMYDLSGRRVLKAQKGIYIRNGKKYILR